MESILTKRSIFSDSNSCNCCLIPDHYCFEYHLIQCVNLNHCLGLIKSRILPKRLSFWAWGAEGQMWSLREPEAKVFTGDPLTSFSFGCLEQHPAGFLNFFRREKSNLSGEPSFIPWHGVGINTVSVTASCIMRHTTINKYSQSLCKIILRQMPMLIIATRCILLKLFIKSNEILTYKERGIRKLVAT